jgi:hypothetical protein
VLIHGKGWRHGSKVGMQRSTLILPFLQLESLFGHQR